MATDWDDAFSNAAYIPGAEQIFTDIIRDAAVFRDDAESELSIPYGPSTRERYDLFMPAEKPKGLMVFIHGGYWIDFDNSAWSHLAKGAAANGWAVCLPTYDLCPKVRISDITQQVGAAITAAAARISGPINITGHSAGGHLAVRMGCTDTPLPADIVSRVKNIVGISGLYDLHPLRFTKMNKDLRIEEAESKLESPALLTPQKHITFTSWVGAAERPEFLRQSQLLKSAWAEKGCDVDYIEAKERHHFDVIAPLADSESALVKKLLS